MPLELPITLLDQCKILNNILYKEVENYHRRDGKILTSIPLKIKIDELPDFMKCEKSKNYEEIKGRSTFILNENKDKTNLLSCFITVSNINLNEYNINLLYDQSIKNNEDFAKVMMELLIFLLH